MKLAPVTAWLVRDRPRLKVVQTRITRELLGICVRRGDDALKDAINEAQRALVEDVKWPRVAGPFLAAAKLEVRLLVVLYQAAKGSVCCF
jgi:polar amino acid transport system substrate-binding protein